MMFERWPEHSRRIATPLVKVAAIVLIGLVYFLGISSERTGFVRDVIDPGFRKLSDPVLNAFRDKPPPVASIALELDSASYDSLLVLQKLALQQGRVQHDGNTLFAATVRSGDRSVPMVVGLREGLVLPVRSKHWPLHIRTLPGDTVLGMQTFDLVPVLDDTPLWSFLLHAVLREQGNVTFGQALAEVQMNGKGIGLYMLQGRPDDTAIARWAHGSGPVLRFDDDMLRDAREAMSARAFPSTPPPQGDWMAAPLLLHSSGGARNSRRAQKAVRRMEAFRSGDLSASFVFDVPHTARLLAMCDLLGTQEAMDWWNVRFLVDSITEQFIPIPLHITRHAPIANIQAEGSSEASAIRTSGGELAARLLADTTLYAQYIAYLDTFSESGWWEATKERTKLVWEPARKAVNAEYPRIDLDMTIITHDRTVILQSLEPTNLVLAYMRDAEKQPDGIALANVHSLPVEVVAVVMNDGDTIPLPAGLQLIPRKKDRPLHYIVLPLAVLHERGTPKAVLVRLAPSLPIRSVPIRSWSTFGAN